MTAEVNPEDSYLYEYLFKTYPLDKVSDADIFVQCVDDFISFLAYEIRSPNSDYFLLEYITRTVIGEQFLEDDEYTPTEVQLKEFGQSVSGIIEKFIDQWWVKFHERSRLIFSNQKLTDEEANDLNVTNNNVIEKELQSDESSDILDYIEDILIKRGEIAFVGEVAKELLRECMTEFIAVDGKAVNKSQEGQIGLLVEINKQISSLCNDKSRVIATFVYDYKKQTVN